MKNLKCIFISACSNIICPERFNSNRKLHFRCSFYAVDTTAIELQTNRAVLLQLAFSRVIVWFAVLLQSCQLHSNCMWTAICGYTAVEMRSVCLEPNCVRLHSVPNCSALHIHRRDTPAPVSECQVRVCIEQYYSNNVCVWRVFCL
jgi:hypothetical protein